MIDYLIIQLTNVVEITNQCKEHFVDNGAETPPVWKKEKINPLNSQK